MKQQQLDEDGLASSYLLLTALIPLSVFLLYSLLKGAPTFKCTCKDCVSKKPKRNVPRIVSTAMACLAVAYLCKNVLTIKINKKTVDFDPFQVLNVSPESSPEEIKKNYRKMLKVFNKKLNKKNFKEEATEGIKRLNRAFTILKDPESLSNWISNGTSKELLIAIPSFVLKFSSSFLMIYIAVIAVAVPVYFLLKHLALRKISFSGSEYVSNERFYEEIGNLSEVPSIILHQCIFIMGKSIEFTSKRWNRGLPKDCVKMLEMDYAIPVMGDGDGYHRILMYLARQIEDPGDREYIRSRSLMLIESFKRIAYLKGKPKAFESLLVLEKMVTQAIFNPDYYQLQYPGIQFEQVSLAVFSNESIKRSLQADEKFINRCLEGRELKTALNVLSNIPTVSISELKAFTIDTAVENCGFDHEESQITKKEGDFFIIPKDSQPYIQFKLTSPRLVPVCHTPFSQESVFNKWTVYLKINDRLEGDATSLDAFEGTKKIKMSIPFSSGRQDVKVFVVSNGYFANDCSSTLTIKFS